MKARSVEASSSGPDATRRRRASARAVELLRWLHVLVGLQAGAALLVYAVSGLAATWNAGPGAVEPARHSESRVYQPREGDGDGAEGGDVALARRLVAALALPLVDPLREQSVARNPDDGSLGFRLSSPNGLYRLRVPAPGVVEIEHARVDLATFLLNVHAYASAWPSRDRDWRLSLWSLYNELALVSLIALAVSGVVLWLATRPRAWLPWAGFALGCASCAALVAGAL